MFPDFLANSIIGRLTWSYPGLGRTVSLRRSEMKEASHPPSHPPPLSNLTLLHPLLMDISLLFKYWYLLRKQKSENFYPDNWPLTKWNKEIPAKVHRHLVEPKQNQLFLRPRCQIIIFLQRDRNWCTSMSINFMISSSSSRSSGQAAN